MFKKIWAAIAIIYLCTFSGVNDAHALRQITDLAFVHFGAGFETLSYYEFLRSESTISWSSTAAAVTSAVLLARYGNLGLLAHGLMGPHVFFGPERWRGDSDQDNDLSYRLARGVVGLGWVLPSGLEPYLGYWYSKGTQARKDFEVNGVPVAAPVSIERVRSRGFVLGLQGVYHLKEDQSLIHYYGDLIIIPGSGSLEARTTNTSFPGAEFHSWGLGIQGAGSYGWMFGSGPGKVFASLQGSMILLFYRGEIRDDLGLEWPRNLTFGGNFMLQLGGGWFSLLE